MVRGTFEPCGFCQLLAMRVDWRCLANVVGGLRETISRGETGCLFSGDAPEQQATDLLASIDAALTLWWENPQACKLLGQQAGVRRLTWDAAA